MQHFILMSINARTADHPIVTMTDVGEIALGAYQTKPLRCEAHRWNASEPPDIWPGWLRSAILDTRHRLSAQVSRNDERLRITTAYGQVTVEDGDWIVYWLGSRQELEVFSHEDFHRKFDPAASDDSESLNDRSARQALRDLHARRPK
jgi:hypothetical protein